jgi:sn-glycerol 3-phosphate transport system ATP-binding protein
LTDIIGVRPDTLTVAPPSGPAISFTGSIELIEPLGNEYHVHLRVDGQPEPLVASLPDGTGLQDGATLTLSAPHADLHQFNQETGLRTNTN